MVKATRKTRGRLYANASTPPHLSIIVLPHGKRTNSAKIKPFMNHRTHQNHSIKPSCIGKRNAFGGGIITFGRLEEWHKLGPLGDLILGLLLSGCRGKDLGLEPRDSGGIDLLTLGANDAPLEPLLQVVVDGLLGKIGNSALGVLVDKGAGERDAHGDGDVLLCHARLGENTGGSDEVLVESPGQRVGVLGLAVEDEDAVGTVERVARSLDVANILVRATVVGTERSRVVLQNGSVGRVRGRSAVASVKDGGADGRSLGSLVGDSSGNSARHRSGSSAAGDRAVLVRTEAKAERGTESRHGSSRCSSGDSAIHNIALLVEIILAVSLGLGGTLAGSCSGSSTRTVQLVDCAHDSLRAAITVGEFRVGVLEDLPVANLVRSPEVAIGVPVEGSQGRVGVLHLASRDSPGSVRSSLRRAVGVWVNALPQSEETVNVHVVKPESRVEGCSRKVGHVASGNTGRARSTKSGVDGVVDALEGVRAPGGARAGVVVCKALEALASAEHLVDLILERSANVVERVGGACGGAAGGVCVAVGVTQSDLPVNERSVDQVLRTLEIVAEQWVDNGDHAGGRLNSDVLVAHHVGQGWVAWSRVCGPVPEGETHSRSGTSHPGTAVVGVRVGELVDQDHELLLEESKVGTVPSREENRVVSAVTVRPAAVAALSDTVPVLARDTMDAGNLVPGHPVALAHPLELLQGEDEQGPLVGLGEEHLPDLQTRVDGSSRNTGDGHEASRLPLLEVVGLIVNIIDILGERLWGSVGESRRSKRQGTEKGRELHDCG